MTAGRPLTYDHLRKVKKPNQARFSLCMDSEVADELYDAEVAEAEARQDANIRPNDRQAQIALNDAVTALDDVRDRARKVTVVFVFKSIGRPKFDALLDLHPQTAKQREELRKQGVTAEINYNADSFPQALVAASLIDPELAEEDVKDMFENEAWNSGELTGLFQTALLVNQQRRVVNLGKDLTPTNSSKTNSTTASRSASRTAGS